MEMSFGSRLKHAWNAFTGNIQMNYRDLGMSYPYRADRPRMSRGNERSIVTSVYNRIALDVAALNVQHVRLDENGRFLSVIDDGLNNCLTLEANVDQTARSFIQDVVISMFDEGSVAIVPVDTTTDPNVSGSYDIQSLRVGQILDWYPQYIRTRVYNEQTGRKEDIVVPKSAVAIIENPLYAVINEPNSTMQRLIRKLTVKLQKLTGKGVVASDDIVINTSKGDKSITLIREGVSYNILNCLDKNTDWFTLAKGDNIFAFTADSGVTNLQFRIENKVIYEGV